MATDPTSTPTTPAAPPQQQSGYPPMRLIPARYIGMSSVTLPPRDRSRKYVNAEGQPLNTKVVPIKVHEDGSVVLGTQYVLYSGDTVQMPDHEILGQTLLIDPTHQQPALWHGWGWCPLPRHAAYTPVDLRDMRFLGPDGVMRYYEFHAPRADFEPLYPEQEPTYFRMPTRAEIEAQASVSAQHLAAAEAAERAYEFALTPAGQAQAQAAAQAEAQPATTTISAAAAASSKKAATTAATTPAAPVASSTPVTTAEVPATVTPTADSEQE